jgi:hypothetical protein
VLSGISSCILCFLQLIVYHCHNCTNIYIKFKGSCTREDLSILGYDAVYIGKLVLTFRRSFLPSSSW